MARAEPSSTAASLPEKQGWEGGACSTLCPGERRAAAHKGQLGWRRDQLPQALHVPEKREGCFFLAKETLEEALRAEPESRAAPPGKGPKKAYPLTSHTDSPCSRAAR